MADACCLLFFGGLYQVFAGLNSEVISFCMRYRGVGGADDGAGYRDVRKSS